MSIKRHMVELVCDGEGCDASVIVDAEVFGRSTGDWGEGCPEVEIEEETPEDWSHQIMKHGHLVWDFDKHVCPKCKDAS